MVLFKNPSRSSFSFWNIHLDFYDVDFVSCFFCFVLKKKKKDFVSWNKTKPAACSSYLPDHPVPDSSNQLAVLAIGDQVEVVGELYGAGQFLQDVYAETFTAQLCVWLSVAYDTERERERKNRTECWDTEFSLRNCRNRLSKTGSFLLLPVL